MGTSAPSLPQVGAILGGKYRVERVLGEGGMGIVFQAVHTRLDKHVAIKMLLPQMLQVPELVGRFEREARAAGRLRHRHSARVIDVDVTADGIPFMVMELLHGHDLETELRARGRLPPGEAVAYVTQACAAMAEAHEAGIVHRDLKPSNLFLSEEQDGTVCVKVLDFGISKLQTPDEARVTSTQTQMGTPLYMSPEQVRSAKNVDLRTDVWSLGVILYELLAGHAPFDGTPMAVAAAIVGDTPPPLRQLVPEVPEALAVVVARAMEKDPARRFASTVSLSEALAPFATAPAAARPSLPLDARQVQTSSPSLVTAPTLAATPADAGARPREPEGATGGSWATSEAETPRPRRTGLLVAGVGAVVVLAGVAFLASRLVHAPPSPAAADSRTAPPAPSASVARAPMDSAAPVSSTPSPAPPSPTTTRSTATTATTAATARNSATPAHGTYTARPRHPPPPVTTAPVSNPQRL